MDRDVGRPRAEGVGQGAAGVVEPALAGREVRPGEGHPAVVRRERSGAVEHRAQAGHGRRIEVDDDDRPEGGHRLVGPIVGQVMPLLSEEALGLVVPPLLHEQVDQVLTDVDRLESRRVRREGRGQRPLGLGEAAELHGQPPAGERRVEAPRRARRDPRPGGEGGVGAPQRPFALPEPEFDLGVPGPAPGHRREPVGGRRVIAPAQVAHRPVQPRAVEPGLDPEVTGVTQGQGERRRAPTPHPACHGPATPGTPGPIPLREAGPFAGERSDLPRPRPPSLRIRNPGHPLAPVNRRISGPNG